MELSKGFLRSTAECFVRDEVRSKLGTDVEVLNSQILLGAIFENELKLDKSILNALC